MFNNTRVAGSASPGLLLELLVSRDEQEDVVEKNNTAEAKLITFINPYSYLIARKQVKLFSRFEVIHFDGVVLKVAMGLIGIKRPRVSFDMTSLAPYVFAHAARVGQSIYFVGGDDGISRKASNLFKFKWPKLKVIGCDSGYVSGLKGYRDLIERVVSINPDIIIAGMGTPLQEQFLVDAVDLGWSGIGYTCGGFLHQTVARGVKYYPKWMNRLHLRWLFRCVDEPALIRRYLKYYPLFAIYFLKDAFKFVWKRYKGKLSSGARI